MRWCLISTIFVQQNKELIREQLKTFFKNADAGISKSAYIEMCELTGQEFDEEKCPPSIEDFPYLAQLAITVFNDLPDSFIGGGMSAPVYNGKLYDALPLMFDLYEVTIPEERRDLFSYIKIIDGIVIKKARDRAEAASKRNSAASGRKKRG